MSTLSDISIKNPVFAWMLMLALIVFGAISLNRLGISQMPDVDFPTLSVDVTWEGAAPTVMEAEIVDRLESSIISVEGIREITSTIRQGQATVTVEFDVSRNVDGALQELQSAISRVRFPLEVDPPIIKKSNPDDQPIMWLGISGKRSLRDLIAYVDLSVKDQFQILPGVGEVILGGFTERNLRVWVSTEALKKNELTILDIRDALQRGHLESAAGRIENSTQELNLRVMGEGMTPEEVGALEITTRGGRPIFKPTLRLRDVARVEDGLADVRRISRVNGVPGIGLGIKKQRGSNAVEVGDRVKKKMAEVAQALPPDMAIGMNFDSTVFVRESVEETEFTLVLSALATAAVCWLFLGSLRPTLNILLSIPTSVMGAFAVMHFMGFTLNLFTILGLALAVGIIVDDAIMVLENIYRHRDMGKDRMRASQDGAREITFAAVAATLAVIAIFLPVAFMTGVIGKFFFQFAVTITAAVGFSLLEAITLVPMRTSQFMESAQEENWIVKLLNRIFASFSALYTVVLRFSLRWRFLVVLIALGMFIGSLTLFKDLRKEFIPQQDQSVFLIRIQTPLGSSLEYTSTILKKAEQILLARPELIRVFAAVGGFGGGEVNTGNIFVSMKPPHERALTQAESMKQIRGELQKIANLKVFLQDLSLRGFTAQRGFPVELNIRGSEWSVLEQKSREIVTKIEATGLLTDIDTDYRLGQPEVQVWPLREEATKRGVEVATITQTVAAAFGGIREGKFTQGSRRYDVRIRLDSEDRDAASDISNLQLRNHFGELVPLKDVARVDTVPTLQTITRRNRERSISIFANVAPQKSQGDALATAERVAQELLPPGYRVYLGSGAKTFIDSFQSLYLVLWLGVLVAYMVLASQFNSFLDPITVLLSLPFSITGAIGALWLTGSSVNLFSMIGAILLMGIVKKNAILLVEFINHQRHVEKMSIDDAILTGAPIRLRPILMTSVATLAAAIPPALALGPGAESRIPMSITIVGGVLVSTVFTLVVVPCVYRMFGRFTQRDTLE
jgi:hydrophobe/amphiphile efflux-1 (HAE1) family protein